MDVIWLRKVAKKCGKGIGKTVTCIGAGVLLTVIVPLWGWIAFGGVTLIYLGIYISKH